MGAVRVELCPRFGRAASSISGGPTGRGAQGGGQARCGGGDIGRPLAGVQRGCGRVGSGGGELLGFLPCPAHGGMGLRSTPTGGENQPEEQGWWLRVESFVAPPSLQNHRIWLNRVDKY
jgi:hypothetical protein